MSLPVMIRWRTKLCRLENIFISVIEQILPGIHLRSCSCCQWKGFYFRSFAVEEYLRHNVICPLCGSFERHRALAYFYKKFFTSLPDRPSRVIHFAPEKCLENLLRSLCDRYERSVYLDGGEAELKLDLTHLNLSNESCDLFLMNHVLDCMSDDRLAIQEMYRVLRVGGVVLAAISFRRGATQEFSVASNTRYREYGSEDLAEYFLPFTASLQNAADDLDDQIRHKNGIPSFLPLLVLRKE